MGNLISYNFAFMQNFDWRPRKKVIRKKHLFFKGSLRDHFLRIFHENFPGGPVHIGRPTLHLPETKIHLEIESFFTELLKCPQRM